MASRRRALRTATQTLASGGPGGGTIRRSVLPGGLRVITEQVPNVRSVAFGVWVGVGSRHETRRQAGASHYLEHLLFKGTPTRSALDISAAFDRVGGEVNAYTAKEYTCYYARVLDADLPLAVDVICDMVLSSVIAAGDVDAERGVILEEIAMNDDDPADAVHDVFAGAVFGDEPLGRPILGSVDSIEGLSRETVAGYWRRGYTPERMVVAAAGNLDHGTVIRLVRKAFQGVDPAAPATLAPVRRSTRVGSRVRVVDRRTEQLNVVLGTTGLPRTDPRRFALSVLNAALGGGMSSRLFQEIREKRGLAYSVYSFTSGYEDTGLFGVYVGCQPSRTRQVLSLVRDELATVAAHGLTDEEVELGRGQVRGGLVLGLEDTGARMTHLGKSELVYGGLLPVAEILRRIEAVTPDDVRDIAAAVLGGPRSLAVVGRVKDADLSWAIA